MMHNEKNYGWFTIDLSSIASKGHNLQAIIDVEQNLVQLDFTTFPYFAEFTFRYAIQGEWLQFHINFVICLPVVHCTS